MKQHVDIQSIREAAHRYNFEQGYMCSESVLKALYEGLELDFPKEVLQAASAFGGGVGGSGCLCGALAGGAMTIGLALGRSQENPSPALAKETTARLHHFFKERNGSTCCRMLTRKFDKSKGENKSQCAGFCAEVAGETARLILDRK